jgi:hypothetical protein
VPALTSLTPIQVSASRRTTWRIVAWPLSKRPVLARLRRRNDGLSSRALICFLASAASALSLSGSTPLDRGAEPFRLPQMGTRCLDVARFDLSRQRSDMSGVRGEADMSRSPPNRR